MGETAALHDLVAQLHDIGNSLDAAIDMDDGKYMGHTAKYWHGQYLVKDRRCERLSIWKSKHSNAE